MQENIGRGSTQPVLYFDDAWKPEEVAAPQGEATSLKDITKLAELNRVMKHALHTKKVMEANPEANKDSEALEKLDRLAELIENTQIEIKKSEEELKDQLKADGIHLDDLRDEMTMGMIQSRKAALESGNMRVVANIDGVLEQVRQAKTLDFMKRHSKGAKVDNKAFNDIFKRTRQKLGINKQFTFRDIRGLDKVLEANLPEGYKEHSRLFLHRLYNFILAKQLPLHAVTIGQVINNIHSLQREDSKSRGEWLENVKEVIDCSLGRK